MGYDLKYGAVTTEHGDIPAGEPVIVFRARDGLAPGVLAHYAQLCRDAGSPDFHVALALENERAFRQWQEENPQQVRVPDSALHRERLEAAAREA